METPSSAMSPQLLRNLLTSIFIHAGNFLFYFIGKHRFLEGLRCFLASTFLFFLRLLPSLFPPLISSLESKDYPLKSTTEDEVFPPLINVGATSSTAVGGDSGVSRALSQLLLIMNDIPVSSRKYEVIRSLTEKLIDENVSEGSQVLRDVNGAVLAAAFARTLSQLEAAVTEQGQRSGGDGAAGVSDSDRYYYFYKSASRLVKGAKYCGRKVWSYAKPRDELSRSGSSAEKLAAEILWLAQKMAASGCADEVVCKWASATNLAWLTLSAEPRLQGSLVKVSAFLIKQAKEIGRDQEGLNDEIYRTPEQLQIRRMKMRMLMSWLPLLCRANNGMDAPILNTGERMELERVLEDIISTLEEEEQERVLSLWLHHFTFCSASDWPNLRACYTRWFRASRAQLLQATKNYPSN